MTTTAENSRAIKGIEAMSEQRADEMAEDMLKIKATFMQSIVYQDKTSGMMFIYKPRYPAQRSFFEQKRAERLIAALEELQGMGNINIFLLKHRQLRKIGERGM